MTELQTGNTYWQTDIRTASGIIRCVVYLYPGAVAKARADPKSNMSLQEKILGYPVAAQLQEEYLAALCAKDAVGLFSLETVDILPTHMKRIGGPPTDQQNTERLAEYCEIWTWRHQE